MKMSRMIPILLFLFFLPTLVFAVNIILDPEIVIPVRTTGITVHETGGKIVIAGSDYVVEKTFTVTYCGATIRADAYLRVNPNVPPRWGYDGIPDHTGIYDVTHQPAARLGTWSELSQRSRNLRTFAANDGTEIQKVIMSWPAGTMTDILAYRFRSNEYFSECVVQFHNIWKSFHKEAPGSLTMSSIENFANKNDPSMRLYAALDQGLRRVAIAQDFSPPRQGIISANALRMRSAPNLDGEIVEVTNGKGSEMPLLGRTRGTTKIDGMDAPWYLVQTVSGPLAWTYGGYIDLNK